MSRIRSALLQAALVAGSLAAASGSAEADACVAWAGEPSPLPQVGDRDPLRARWAALRARELARRASDLEAPSPETAHLAWRHVLCLDPGDESARAGALRTAPLHVHRPAIELVSEIPAAAPDTDVWAGLGAPIAIVARAQTPAPQRAAEALRPGAPPELDAPVRAESLRRIDRSLASAESQTQAARFGDALETLARARGALEALPAGRDLDSRWLRLELVTATAEVARGDTAAARACLERVLALDPDFAFDAAETSPRLLRLLDAARAQQGAAP